MNTFDWDGFFDKWERKAGISVFAKDGIVCPEEYEGILFVLKDVNNAKPEDEIDLRITLQTRTDEGKTWFDVAAWAAALIDGEILEDITHELQHRYIRRTAVMNIKKEAGGPRVTDSEIKKYARLHTPEILEEIIACKPRLIVACSSAVYDALAQYVFMQDKKQSYEQIKLNDKMKKYGRYINIGEYLGAMEPVYLIEYRHPNQCGLNGTRKEHCENMLKIREFAFGK